MELELSDCDTSWDSLSLGEIDEYGKTIEDLLSIEPSSEKKKEIPKDDSSTKSCSKEKENNSQEQPMEVEVTSIPSSSSAGASGSTVTVTKSNVQGLDLKKNLMAAKSLKSSLIENKAAFRNAKFSTPIREIKVGNALQEKPQQLSSHTKNKEGRTKIQSITFDIGDNNKSTPKLTPKLIPKLTPKLTPKSAQQQQKRKKRSVKTTSDNSLVIDVDASVASVPDEGSPFDGGYQKRRKSPNNNNDNSFSAINSMDDTYDMMKMYAPEEDCVSIYSKIKPLDRPNFSKPSAASHSNNPNDQSTIQLVTMLMECKQPARARMGAEVFCEFLSTNQNSCHFSEGIVRLIRTLMEQLLEFSDFGNIERILRLTISAQLRIGESVCAKLLEGLHQNHSSVSAVDILNQMSERHLFNTMAAKKILLKWNTLKTPQKQPRSFICDGNGLKMQVNAMEDSTPLVDMNASDSLYEDMDVEDSRTSSQNQFPFSSEDSTDNFTSAIESGDWNLTGRSFANLVWKLGDDINNKSLLSHLVEMLIVNHTYDPSEFIAFDLAARIANRKSAGGAKTDRLVAQCLSRIAVTLVYLAVPGYAYHVVTYLMKKNVICLDAIDVMEEETTEDLPPQPVRNLIKFVRVAQCNSDFVLAKQLFRDYFKKTRLGHKRPPRGRPMVNHNSIHSEVIELLCDLSMHCSELRDIDEAITFLRILPTSCKGETVVNTMSELLRTLLLNRGIFGEAFNVAWSGAVATMLLDRNEITLIRRTLSSGHLNAEKSELFNFLERHRLYCAPRIALRPHLILMPHTMSLTEMTLSIYRHLTELVEFLMGIGENLNQTLPLRVVLLRKCGPFMPLDPTVMPEEAYFASEERLVETVFKLLKPPLRVLGRKMVNNTHPHHLYETMFNIDMRSVRVWFFENTKYKENIKKSCSGLLQAPCLPLLPHQLHPPINPEIMKIEPTFMHAAALASITKLKVEKPAKRFITNKIASVLESLMKKPGNQ